LSDRDEETYLDKDISYAIVRQQIKGYEFGFTETTDIDTFVQFSQIPKKGWRDERFMAENPDFFKAYTDLQKARGDDPLDWKPLEKIPSVKYDDLSDEWREQLDLYDSYADPESLNFIEDSEERAVKREPMLFTEEVRTYSGVKAKNKTATDFQLARYELDGYEAFIPDEYIKDYVGWRKVDREGEPENWALNTGQSGEGLWFEDDWYLQEHLDFAEKVYRDMLGHKLDFTDVPTRKVFDLYLSYIQLPHLKAKDDFRAENRDLDAWLVAKFDYTPIVEKIRRSELTTYERFIEQWAERGAAIEESLRALRGE